VLLEAHTVDHSGYFLSVLSKLPCVAVSGVASWGTCVFSPNAEHYPSSVEEMTKSLRVFLDVFRLAKCSCIARMLRVSAKWASSVLSPRVNKIMNGPSEFVLPWM
jgi:hypothetical protein